jgi:hypothetical protein
LGLPTLFYGLCAFLEKYVMLVALERNIQYKEVMFFYACFFIMCFTGSISQEDLNEIKNGIYAVNVTTVTCQTIGSIAILWLIRWFKGTLICEVGNLIDRIPLLPPQTIGAPVETLGNALENFLEPGPQDAIV